MRYALNWQKRLPNVGELALIEWLQWNGLRNQLWAYVFIKSSKIAQFKVENVVLKYQCPKSNKMKKS